MEMAKNGGTFNYVLLDKEYISRVYLRQVVSRLRPGYKLMSEGDCIKCIRDVIGLHPDFIITGVIFSDGVSFTEYRRLNCHIPLIVYTRDKNQVDKTEGLNVVHYALKPVSETEVELSLSHMEHYLNKQTQYSEQI